MQVPTLLDEVLDLFFPSLCLGCSQQPVNAHEILCLGCLKELPKTNFATTADNPIRRLFTGKLEIEKAWAYLYYQKGGIVQNIFHQLKYHNRPEVGKLLGQLAANDLHEVNINPSMDLIIPVPIHPKKLQERGYNQSVVIGTALASGLALPILTNHLIRTEHTATQTRKSRYDRHLNVENVFAVHNSHDLVNKHALLIDDVVTTGSTLEACGRVLKKVDGLQLSIFSTAFAP